MRRIGPSVVGASDNSNNEEEQVPAIVSSYCLMSRPRCLYTLWDEYESGMDGRKPARLLTSSERGKCKKVYSFRNRFWSTVNKMIRRGNTSRVAIDRIYSVLGESKSVTAVLRALTPAVVEQLLRPEM